MISVLGTHQHADESLRKIRTTAMIGRQCCDRPTVGCGTVRMRLFFLVRTAGIVLGETIDGIRRKEEACELIRSYRSLSLFKK